MKIQKYQKSFDFSYALGFYPVFELVHKRPELVLEIIASTKAAESEGLGKIRQICAKRGIQVKVDDKALEKISSKENTFIAGVFKKYALNLVKNENHIVLVNPESFGNLGAIIRTMSAFSIINLGLIKPCADYFSPETIRASMGSVFSINFEYFESFEMYQHKNRNNIYSFMTNAKESLENVKFKKPYALVFGSESKGLSEDFLNFGTSVKIPQSSLVDSLNLSIAAGIAMYQASK